MHKVPRVGRYQRSHKSSSLLTNLKMDRIDSLCY
nr:MAG TPA: hypothetical protein [Caudoviricetes sp.]